MAMKLGFMASVLACAVLFGLGADLTGGEPLTGKQLFEKEWQFNDSAESLSETDFNNAVQLTADLPAAEIARLALRRDRQVANGDGLGPLHNAKSCQACHDGGGGSGVEHNVTLITVDPRSEFLRQIGPRSGKAIMDFYPGLISAGGGLSFNTVVHDKSTRDGYDEIRNRLSKYVPGEINGEWFVPGKRNAEAISKQPVVAGRYGTLDFYLSQRNSPALFGLSLIDAIGTGRMQAIASRQAAESKGEITGRVAGKFGWRGQVPTLAQFVRGACAGELGLNQGPLAGQANDPADPEYVSPNPDITLQEVRALTSFVASFPKPVESPPKGHDRRYVRGGEKIFNSIGCATCHVPDLLPATDIFSDLLLHDMGTELQAPFPAPVGDLGSVGLIDPVQFDGGPFRRIVRAPGYYGATFQVSPPLPYPFPKPEEPQFPRGELSNSQLNGFAKVTWDALQREWKTPPLWGVADSAPYLHDGRAETLGQAIEWHGGEAASSRQRYERLEADQKDKLIAFLSSLRAP